MCGLLILDAALSLTNHTFRPSPNLMPLDIHYRSPECYENAIVPEIDAVVIGQPASPRRKRSMRPLITSKKCGSN
jgi:hypothetical protein